MGERLPDSDSAKSERLTHDGIHSLGSGSRSSDARLIIGLAVLHHLSIPDISRHLERPISTVRRRLDSALKWGFVLYLAEDEAKAANRARVQNGGVASSRRPVMFGRGPRWLSIAAECGELVGGRLPERAGVRDGRLIRVHDVRLTCDIIKAPGRLSIKQKQPGGEWALVPRFEPRQFGANGQVLHEKTLRVDGLTWRACLWSQPHRGDAGWSRATLTLAKESHQWVDSGQVHAFTLHLYEAACRAMQHAERLIECRLQPMHLLDFSERCHAALNIEGPSAEFLASLPHFAREWTLADGRKVWGDFSHGSPELESGLPSRGAADLLPLLDEGLAWALKDPEGLNGLRGEVSEVSEEVRRLAGALNAFIAAMSVDPEPTTQSKIEGGDSGFMFG